MEKIKGKVKEFLNPNDDDDPRTHYQRAKKVWKALPQYLEYSAYSTLGEKGELQLEKFPSTLMKKETREAYYAFKGEIKEAEESYLKAQQNNQWYIKDTLKDKRARAVFKQTNHVLKVWNLRDNFEKSLSSYIEARIEFESIVDRIQSLVNNFVGSEPEEVPTKIKQNIKDLFELGQKWALQVGQHFNLMSIWSIMITPSIPGSYSWYNLRRGKEVTRDPWHQHVVIQEAQDVFGRLELACLPKSLVWW